MLGFIIGTVSLIALVKVVRGGRFGWRGRHWGRMGWGREWMMRRLSYQLEATPAQERVIAQAAEQVEHAAMKFKDDLFGSRAEVAKAVRADHFDGEAFRAATDRQQAAFEAVRKALVEGLQMVHEALSPNQRQKLGDLIEYGPRHGHRWGYAGGGGCGGRFASSGGAVNL